LCPVDLLLIKKLDEMGIQNFSEIPFFQHKIPRFLNDVQPLDNILSRFNDRSKVGEMSFPSFEYPSQIFEFRA
jgi:hypothetical protein